MNEELGAILREARESRHSGASGRRLAEIAQAAGYDIDRTQINHLIAGKYRSRPTRKTIDAIAYLAGREAVELYDLALLPATHGPFAKELPSDVDTLDENQRRAVLDLINNFLKQNRQLAREYPTIRALTDALDVETVQAWLQWKTDQIIQGGDQNDGRSPSTKTPSRELGNRTEYDLAHRRGVLQKGEDDADDDEPR